LNFGVILIETLCKYL